MGNNKKVIDQSSWMIEESFIANGNIKQVKVNILSVQQSHEGKYQLRNGQGVSEPAELKIMVDGKMGLWGEFGPCSQSCIPSDGSSGFQKRMRVCTPPINGGLPCIGEFEETQKCNLHQCPEWSNWSGWSACSVSCGTGTRISQRKCFPQRDACEGLSTRTEECNTHNCPVNCQWDLWSTWSSCSSSCGKATHTRYY